MQSQFGYAYKTFLEGYVLLICFIAREVVVDLLLVRLNLPFGAKIINRGTEDFVCKFSALFLR